MLSIFDCPVASPTENERRYMGHDDTSHDPFAEEPALEGPDACPAETFVSEVFGIEAITTGPESWQIEQEDFPKESYTSVEQRHAASVLNHLLDQREYANIPLWIALKYPKLVKQTFGFLLPELKRRKKG